MGKILSICFLSVGLLAPSGVDHGSGKSGTFYNMKHNYSLSLSENLLIDTTSPTDALRIDVPLTYRNKGYFVLSKTEDYHQVQYSRCKEHKFKQPDIFLVWVGNDCADIFFQRQFEALKESVRYVTLHK